MWIKTLSGNFVNVEAIDVNLCNTPNGVIYNIIGWHGNFTSMIAEEVNESTKDEIVKDIETAIINGAVFLDVGKREIDGKSNGQFH